MKASEGRWGVGSVGARLLLERLSAFLTPFLRSRHPLKSPAHSGSAAITAQA